jgi:serine/threonine protein kinase
MKPGDTISRFTVTDRAGATRLSEDYNGYVIRDNGFKQKVLLRLVRHELGQEREFVQSYVSRSLLAARLSHRNILQVHELGRDAGRYYVALEYLPGKTMREILDTLRQRGQELPRWFTFQVIAAVCKGLRYAHDFRDENFKPLAVLHQGLRPENILVSFRGAIKIQNFCVASIRVVGDDDQSRDDMSYVAPERVTSGVIDPRSDIFSAGMVLYELLTGVRPPRDRELMHRRTGSVQGAAGGAVGVPADVEPLLMRAIAEEPDRRFKNVGVFGKAVRTYLEERLEPREPVDLGEFVAALFPDERGPVMTSQWGTPAVESVVDRVGPEDDLVDKKEPVTFRFKREDGSSFIISGLEGWELDSGDAEEGDLFNERPSTQSMPVIQIKRLKKETARPGD